MAELHEIRSTREGYDRWAAQYDDRDPSTLLDEPFLRRYCAPMPGGALLDVGCGTGRYLRTVDTPDVMKVGLDLSFGMLKRAHARSTTAPASAARSMTWIQGSAWELPFRDRSFTHLVSGLVLDHVPELDLYFRELSRVLAPGGWAVISGIHPDMQRMTGCDIVVAGIIHIPGVIHEMSAVSRAAAAAGFEVVAEEEPPVTEEMVAQRPDWQSRIGHPALVLLALRKPLG